MSYFIKIVLLSFVLFLIAFSIGVDNFSYAQTTAPKLRWIGHTIAPTIYRGRTLPGKASIVSVIAEEAPPSLNYLWEINGLLMHQYSGVGKTTLRYRIPDNYREEYISIGVTLYNKANVAQGSAKEIAVPVSKPKFSLTGENNKERHTLNPRGLFNVPTSGARFFLNSYFAPFAWSQTKGVLWTIIDQVSTVNFQAITKMELSASNRGSNDIETSIQATLEKSTITVPINIEGVQQSSKL